MVEMEVVVISEEEEEQQLDLEMMMLENDDNLMETRLQTQTKSGLIKLESLKFLRVLLVEFDDSTRSIISALLRKSGYRVVAVADGLKAWETLQDRSHNIDLVLAEVQLPSPLSGLSLLNRIMGDDLYRNTPVIMMSSYDAVNVVFKCMLGGAADFLVKPVRKNELRNLWQHVWRRNSATSAEKSPSIPTGNPPQKAQSFEETSSTKQQQSSPSVAPPSQRGIDAHSSCGKLNKEDDNMDMEAKHNLSQLKSRNVSFKKSTKRLKEGKSVNLDDAKDKPVRLTPEVVLVSDEQHANAGFVVRGKDPLSAPARDHSSFQTATYCTQDEQLKPSREAMDLIGSFDNHEYITPCEQVLPNTTYKNCSSTTRLELSLKRSHFGDSEIQGAETQRLNHSNASAFSRYHQRTANPPLYSESQEDASASCKHEKDHALGLTHKAEVSKQAVISVPIPVNGTRVDGIYSGYGARWPELFYAPGDPLPLQSPNPVPRHEAVFHVYSSDHSNRNDEQSNCKSTDNTTAQKQLLSVECLGESKHISMAAQSVNSSLCNSSSSNRNSSGCGSVCDGSNGNETAVTNAAATQREAALNKFRLKRKDRCFDKKVRYQSRKRLAEQRPRVKGQFVRQISS